MLSRVRSDIPIYAFTRNVDTQRRVALYRGVISHSYPFNVDRMEDALKEIKKELLGLSLVNAGDFIIITSGLPLKVSGGTNSLRIIKI